MTLLYCNGVGAPPPTSYDVTFSDIQSSDSGRSDDGVMQIEMVRTDVASIDVAWEKLTSEEEEQLLASISSAEIKVKFYYGGNYYEREMYKGDRKLKLVYTDSDGNSYWDVSFSLVQY